MIEIVNLLGKRKRKVRYMKKYFIKEDNKIVEN